jgi:hypothetical protein
VTKREQIEKTILYLRKAEGLFLTANDTGSFEEIRELIGGLERQKQNLNAKGTDHEQSDDRDSGSNRNQ